MKKMFAGSNFLEYFFVISARKKTKRKKSKNKLKRRKTSKTMKKRAILIEIFIWSVILAIIFTIAIFSYSKIFVEPNVYTIQFKDIDGITKGSPVRFMGINIGYVRNLKSKDKHVNVQILVTQKDMKIPNGTTARVEFYGLGASKSIELMPPDGSCDVGILTGDTIRLNDVVHEAYGIVEIIEMAEKYVKGINKAGAQKFFEDVQSFKDDGIKNLGSDFSNLQKEMNENFEEIKMKQHDIDDKIKHVNQNVEKINKFIKK